MARIIVRNTAVSGSIPTSLVQGELSLNVTDGKLYYGSSSRNVVKEFTGSASGGGGGTINTGSLLTTASFNAYTGSNTSQFAGTASFASNGGVTSLIAGSGVSLSPTNGKGDVTVTSLGAAYNTMTGSYGSFYDTGSVSATSATRIYSMSLSTTDISNGVFVSSSSGDTTKIKFTNAGVYNLQFSAQFSNSDSSTQDAVIWVRKNGTDVVDSSGTVGVPPYKAGSNGQVIASWNYYLNLSANDYIQLCWHVEQANVITLETIAAGTLPTHPRTPSLILTAQRVDTFLSNTGSFSGSFTGGFTGSLFGTASWATNALTASYVLQAVSSSYAVTSSYAITSVSASYALTASYAPNYVLNSSTSSMLAPYVLTSSTSSMSVATASFASTASYVVQAISSSFASTASFLNNTTNAFIQNGNSFGATALLGTNDNQSLALQTSGSTRMFISNSGNVGIGTVTPTAPLHVIFNGSNTTGINIDNTANTVNHIGFLRNGTTYGRFGINASTGEFRWDSLSSYFPTIYSSGVERMRIDTSGNVGISTTTPAARLDVSGSVNISGSGVQVPLQITSGSTSLLFVSSSGNIGIGTSTPDSYYAKKLVISAVDESGITLAGTTTSATNYVAFADGTTGNQAYRGYVAYKHLTDQLAFGSSGILRATIDSSGNFGIGTSTPTAKLDVSGSARITNQLTLSNYTNSGSFPGTGSAMLAVNNSGSVITQAFRDVAEQVYTGSIAWTGTAAPSGSTTHTYRWSQIGKTVNLNITLVYTGPGNAVSSVTTALPADCPTPYVPSGQSGAGALISVVSAHLTPTTTLGANIARGGLRINLTNDGYELVATATAASYKVLVTSVQYFAV